MEIIDIVEKAIKTGKCGINAIGCCQGANIDCSRCPFDLFNNRDVLGLSNEELKGCVTLSEEEIQKIAKHYLEKISVDK